MAEINYNNLIRRQGGGGRLQDARDLYNNYLRNQGFIGYKDREQQFSQAQRLLDLYYYAVENGFDPRELNGIGDLHGQVYEVMITDYLKNKGLLNQAEAQAGTLNKAKAAGYTGSNFDEAFSFLNSYNTAKQAAAAAGMPVNVNTTFADIQNWASQNQSQFNSVTESKNFNDSQYIIQNEPENPEIRNSPNRESQSMNTVIITTPDGVRHNVQVNSKAYDKYLKEGGKIGTSTPTAKTTGTTIPQSGYYKVNGILYNNGKMVSDSAEIQKYYNSVLESNGSSTGRSTYSASTTQPGSYSPGVQPPTTNLQPGQTGNDVLQLQKYLVANGYMTQAQMNTGPGIYGPQTTAAVAKLQQSLGVDNSSGPGYWGPRTISAVSNSVSNLASNQNQNFNNSPLVNDLVNDPTKSAAFNALPDEMKALFLETSRSLEKAIEAGKVVNPNIEITPKQLQQFYDQAVSELDPYYQEQYSTLEGDLKLSLNRMVDDYTRSVQRAEDPFKQALATQAENEAQQGTAFSSERNRREATNVLGQNQALDDAFRSTQRSAQDLLRGYESKVGTSKARSLSLPSLSQYSANTQGFNTGQSRSLDPGLLGGISFGSLGAERETNLRSRQNQLEQSYRQNRVLDYSSL